MCFLSLRWSSCTDFLLWESLCGTSLPSQCSSASSGLFCSLSSCAQTPCLPTPQQAIRESCSSCSQGVTWQCGSYILFLYVCLYPALNTWYFCFIIWCFLRFSVSECCATPYSLLGLTFVVSYLALGLLNLCKFYLGGYAAVQNENVMHRWEPFYSFNPFWSTFNPEITDF